MAVEPQKHHVGRKNAPQLRKSSLAAGICHVAVAATRDRHLQQKCTLKDTKIRLE
jgi:hypothetical protein